MFPLFLDLARISSSASLERITRRTALKAVFVVLSLEELFQLCHVVPCRAVFALSLSVRILPCSVNCPSEWTAGNLHAIEPAHLPGSPPIRARSPVRKYQVGRAVNLVHICQRFVTSMSWRIPMSIVHCFQRLPMHIDPTLSFYCAARVHTQPRSSSSIRDPQSMAQGEGISLPLQSTPIRTQLCAFPLRSSQPLARWCFTVPDDHRKGFTTDSPEDIRARAGTIHAVADLIHCWNRVSSNACSTVLVRILSVEPYCGLLCRS